MALKSQLCLQVCEVYEKRCMEVRLLVGPGCLDLSLSPLRDPADALGSEPTPPAWTFSPGGLNTEAPFISGATLSHSIPVTVTLGGTGEEHWSGSQRTLCDLGSGAGLSGSQLGHL